MAERSEPAAARRSRPEWPGPADRAFWASVYRAFGGALFFSLPMIMTMEMWWLGFYMNRMRLAVLILFTLALLTGLARILGFWRDTTWGAALREALMGFGVGVATAAALLGVLGVLTPPYFGNETIGKVALQMVPASIGAIVASGQFGGAAGERRESHERETYRLHLLFSFTGAVFLAFAVAPTEEMILIAFKMGPERGVLLALATLAVMHATTGLLQFRRKHEIPPGTPAWVLFFRYTVPAYAIALLVSAYVLWTFGRYEFTAPVWMVTYAIVLGFPAGLGAAGARLLL